jgi:very-short-patch-repair endonuclease
LIDKSAAELDAAVDRNRTSRAGLDLILAELGHRSTPSARQVATKARRYVRELDQPAKAVREKTAAARHPAAPKPPARARAAAPTSLNWTDPVLRDRSSERKHPTMRDDEKSRQRRDWVHQAIRDLRAKLIDLGKRNPLVSFKHSERGATYLRIIDERPDILFETLTAGDMRFEVLPDEDDIPRDERTDDFRITFERAQLTDEAYLRAIEGLGEEEQDAAAIQQAERALRAGVRAQLGLPKLIFGKAIDIATLARAHGFDPSFELKDSGDETDAEHHLDDRIRVLLTTKQLERRLTTIHDRYRGHESETGLHTLFLAFGFVEWFEDDESGTPLHAPALLLPVHLHRKLVNGRHVFTLSGADEDLQVNVAMRELLRQRFGLEAPALREKTDTREADTPESYFIRLSQLLGQTKRFRLRRFVTLAVLPFPRMVLWQDLDPEHWPEGAFESHDLLARLLGAESSGGAPDFGEDYAIDDPAFAKAVPSLVTDADVSQHSALIDVAEGTSLAVEGPPGTGKSQTITNMIASALDAGKRVLFVAEKQAALSVVAERLRALGFGPLLLELHSDRATKTGLLDSVRERIDAKVKPDKRNIGETAGDLHFQRTQLRTYLSLLRQPLGSLGRTAHQLMWRVLNLRQGIPDTLIVAGERDAALDDAATLTPIDLDRRRALLDQIATKIDEHVESYGSIEANGWSRARAIEVFDAAAILAAARTAGERAAELGEALERVRAETRYPLGDAARSIAGQVDAMQAAPLPGAWGEPLLASVLAEPGAARTLLSDQRRWMALAAEVAGVHADPLGIDPARLEEVVVLLAEAKPQGATVAEVHDGARQERERHRALLAVEADAAALAARFGLDVARMTTSELQALTETLADWGRVGEGVGTLARSALLGDGFPQVLTQAQAAADGLAERRHAMQATADAFAASPDMLAQLADGLEGAGLFERLFGGHYKRSRRTADRMVGTGLDREAQAERLRTVRQLLLDEHSFSETSPARPYVPAEQWAGITSDWQGLSQARALAERSYDRLTAAGLDRLVGPILDASALDRRVPIQKAATIDEPLRGLSASDRHAPLPDVTARLGEQCARLDHLAAALADADLHPQAPLVLGDRTVAAAIVAFQAADAAFHAAERPAGFQWLRHPADAHADLEAAIAYGEDLSTTHPDVLAALASSPDPIASVARIREAGCRLGALIASWEAASTQLAALVGTDADTLAGDGAHAFPDMARLLLGLAEDEAGLRLAADLKRYLADAEGQGCRFVIDLALGHHVAVRRLPDIYELLACRAVLGRYLRADGAALNRLGGLTLEAIRERFRAIDRDLQQMDARRIVAQRLAEKAPWGNDRGPKGTYTESALIENELGKRARHIPIRDLTKRAGHALQALKPVWMMSPASVAQYVQPGTVTFDLVIIDEASQMRPEYATSAILRGAQLVVVGDSKQLPPTDFFQTTAIGSAADDDGDDGDGTVTVDTESVLDLANERIGARRQLSWHYRSRHESLIQFSNREFYQRRLVVFPSPSTDDPLLGVKHVHVDGVYDASINQIEAEAVIRDAIGLMIAHPECSMGIATMNLKQTELIKAEFERLAGQEPAVRSYIEAYAGSIDRFFIKNLENVQGDERDIILISTVYGPDKTGRVMQRFGPIASDVGHRRLNVLVTRARLSTRLYTSLKSGDIKIVDSSKPGTIATQAYLTYAEGGARFDLADGGEPDSDFEVFVADRLRAAGFEVVHQVGVEKFRIDLGVRHPDFPLGFIAGIECDGARYHSGFTVRDRDKIRQAVLEGLGWNIYRIWSTDWFTDPDREAARLLAKVTGWRDKALAQFRARQESGEFRRETVPPVVLPLLAPPPVEAVVSAEPANDEVQPAAPGPREIPSGRKRSLDDIDWYEVVPAQLYEVWPGGSFAGEVEVLSRATGAPQIYGGAMRIPRSEYRGIVEATGETFIEHDLYAAVRKVARLGRGSVPDAEVA